jgi:NHS family xanthosine MFS transporter
MVEFVKEQGNSISADGIFANPVLMKDWHTIWLSFAAYALVIAIAFAILFKHKHDPKELEGLKH